MNLTSPLAQDEGASEGEPLASADALQSGSLPKIVGPHRKTICSLFSKSKTTRVNISDAIWVAHEITDQFICCHASD